MYYERVRRYPSPSTPMIRLTDFPDDILEEVFHAMRRLMCFPGEREPERISYGDTLSGAYDSYRNAYTPKPVPLWANVIALSHVCSHWRSLMLTRPRLWTFIRVTGSFSNRIMVNEMLERAGSFPLSVLFVHPAHSRGKVGRDTSAVYDVLGIASVVGDHSARIRELGVVLNSSEQVALVLDTLGKCPVPHLEKLWLDNTMPNTGSGFATIRASLLDNAMPPLRVLHAASISIPWLPYERLVRLELSRGPAPPLAALLHTLRHSPELEILALRIPTAKADLARSPSESALDELHDEPPAVLSRLRRLALDVEPAHDAAFSVLPHIVFPLATAVALRFAGRVESPVYEDCGALEDLAGAVRRATFVLHSPGFASLSSAAPSPTADAGADADEGEGEERAPALRVEWEVSEDERWASTRGYRPVARLCEGFKAVPLPALVQLSVVIVPYGGGGDRDRDDGGGWGGARSQQERFRRLWESVPTLESLELRVHPELATQVFATLAARAREELPAPEDESAMDGFGWDDDDEAGEGEAQGVEGEIVCPELKRLRVTWWEQPSVDDLWCVERCCFARANADARLEHLETVEFPEVVLEVYYILHL
ncbi:hypothetical protein LXA43DRAFT_1179428 [Ganoderma leucocontextum]|nr:hypothetical protein LXA43DRAFT_1179428 [Ganoderma leucocontextum]